MLKGVPDRPEVVLVRLREIRSKIDKKLFAQDRSKNPISVKDVVRVLEGPCKVSFLFLVNVKGGWCDSVIYMCHIFFLCCRGNKAL